MQSNIFLSAFAACFSLFQGQYLVKFNGYSQHVYPGNATDFPFFVLTVYEAAFYQSYTLKSALFHLPGIIFLGEELLINFSTIYKLFA